MGGKFGGHVERWEVRRGGDSAPTSPDAGTGPGCVGECVRGPAMAGADFEGTRAPYRKSFVGLAARARSQRGSFGCCPFAQWSPGASGHLQEREKNTVLALHVPTSTPTSIPAFLQSAK